MSESMLKLPFILIGAWAMDRAVTSPNPVPLPSELVGNQAEMERNNRGAFRVAAFLKITYWAFIIAETTIILATNYPSHPLSACIISVFTPAAAAGAKNIRVTTSFLVGTLLITIGGLIRMCCYRALGKLFTFEFTVRKGHKLVTSGPYSIVRHPSYTGGLIGLAGAFLCQLSKGSWMRECGVLQTTPGKSFVGFWAFMEVLRRGYAVKRAAQEDEAMKKEFGAQWIAWSQRVRYRIFPGIY